MSRTSFESDFQEKIPDKRVREELLYSSLELDIPKRIMKRECSFDDMLEMSKELDNMCKCGKGVAMITISYWLSVLEKDVDQHVTEENEDEADHVEQEELEEGSAFEMLKRQIVETFDRLSEIEQQVLRQRFGIDDGQPRTLEEVGSEFGISREQIRQIEAKALRMLRDPSRSKKLKDYLD